MTHMFTLMNSLGGETTETDTRALLACVNALPAADATRMGPVGYCMSRPLVMWVAAAFPDRLRNMATAAPDSPHRIAAQVHCESYFACAEIDKWAPPADMAALQAALEGAKTPHRIEWYPKVEHGVTARNRKFDRTNAFGIESGAGRFMAAAGCSQSLEGAYSSIGRSSGIAARCEA